MSEELKPSEKNRIRVLVEMEAYGESGGWYWVSNRSEDGDGPHDQSSRGIQVRPERVRPADTVQALVEAAEALSLAEDPEHFCPTVKHGLYPGESIARWDSLRAALAAVKEGK